MYYYGSEFYQFVSYCFIEGFNYWLNYYTHDAHSL